MNDEDDQTLNRDCDSPLKIHYGPIELGRGRYGTIYLGVLRGIQVAVKKIAVQWGREQGEAAMLKMDHPFVVKLFHIEDQRSFRFLAMELCAGTLKEYCDGTFFGPVPEQFDAMLQMSSGLCHIHSHHLVHGDIKPENILITYPSADSQVVFKIAEFGVCKITPKLIYLAPELMDYASTENDKLFKMATPSSDTYALGFSFLHFFNRGSKLDNGYYVNEPKSDVPVLDLINRMTSSLAELRPDMLEVVKELVKLRPLIAPKIKCTVACCMKTGWVYACSFHPWKPKLACSLDDGKICLFSGQSQMAPLSQWCSRTLNTGTQSWVTALDWNAKGTRLAAGCGDGTVVVWDEDGEETFRVKLHRHRVNCLSWNKRDSLVSHLFVTGSDDNLALIWNSTNGSTHRFKGHTCGIRQVIWIASFQFASLDDKTINVWHWDRLKPVTSFRHNVSIRWMHWIPESHQLARCCVEGSFTVCSLSEKAPREEEMNYPKDHVACFDLYHNLLMASGNWDSTISVWDFETSDVPRILTGHSGWIVSVLFSPDGKYLASVDKDRLLCIWSTLSWQTLFHIRVPCVDWNCLCWDSYSRKLAVANQTANVWVVEVESSEY